MEEHSLVGGRLPEISKKKGVRCRRLDVGLVEMDWLSADENSW